MAIFNEAYLARHDTDLMEYCLVEDTEESINESDGALDIIMPAIIATGIVIIVGSAIKSVADAVLIRSALKKYPTIHSDCVPIGDFQRKLYTIKPYENAPGKEMGPLKRIIADKGIFKRGFDKCVCYFYNNRLAMFYCYKISRTHHYKYSITKRSIAYNIIDKNLQRHSQYYITAFLKEQKMTNKDSLEWAKSV